ncbi:18250_t:CDS:1, partial [Funneliformis geosporum]
LDHGNNEQLREEYEKNLKNPVQILLENQDENINKVIPRNN